MNRRNLVMLIAVTVAGAVIVLARSGSSAVTFDQFATTNQTIAGNAASLVAQGRHVFRFDTFGDQAFWGDSLHLHQAIEGSKFGGVGAGVSPNTALAVGLKVDVDALPASLIAQIKQGQVDLDDPGVHACPSQAQLSGWNHRIFQARREHEIRRHPVRSVPLNGGQLSPPESATGSTAGRTATSMSGKSWR